MRVMSDSTYSTSSPIELVWDDFIAASYCTLCLLLNLSIRVYWGVSENIATLLLDIKHSNPHTLISDFSNVSVENSDFDSDNVTIISDSDTECSHPDYIV